MKRLLVLASTCLLAACSSQHRVDPEPDFANPDPAPDESPEPRLGEIESLISQAKLEIKRRDYDEARVKLHQVFRRDRWHPEANTLYQDLQISRGMGDALYQEYLDLYEANKQRGDALWFHLRPLLIKRGIKACEVEEHEETTEEDRKKASEIANQYDVPDLTMVDQILELDPWEFGFVHERAKLKPKETMDRYREALDENPSSGDALCLYAMAVWGADRSKQPRVAAEDLMRKGWILDLPGILLRSGLAAIYENAVIDAFEQTKESATQDVVRSRLGWELLLFHFSKLVLATNPNDASEQARLRRLQSHLEGVDYKLEDLSQRK